MNHNVSVPPTFSYEDGTKKGPGGDPLAESTETIQNRTTVLTCPVSAIPPPQITWYKNEREIAPGDLELDDRIRILKGGKVCTTCHVSTWWIVTILKHFATEEKFSSTVTVLESFCNMFY